MPQKVIKSGKAACKKCRIIRSITIIGILLLVVILSNLEQLSAL